MTKILFAGPYPEKGCGVSKYEENLINLFPSQEGIQIHHIQINFLKKKNPLEIFKLIGKSLKIDPNIIQIQYTPTLGGPFLPLVLTFIKKFMNKKIVIISHESIYIYTKEKKFLTLLLQQYEKIIISACDYFLVHNKSQHKLINLPKNQKSKVREILFTIGKIPIIKTSNSETLTKYQIPQNQKYNFAFFGQIKEKKGVDLLIEAIREMPLSKRQLFNLLILGKPGKKDLDYYENLKEISRDLKNVYFTGFIEEEDIASILSQIKLLILPYKNCTTSSVLLKEAIPWQIPVIASNTGGLSQVSEWNIGFNFETENIEDLSQKIIHFLEIIEKNEPLYKKFKINCQKIAQRHSPNEIKKQYLSIYSQLQSDK